jgi:uncharacterized protein (DUF779 family)
MAEHRTPRVIVTKAASAFITVLREQHGPLMFFQSGGCCDGSAPLCYRQGDFAISESDVCLGSIEESPFYMDCDQFKYWQHTQLIIDVVDGNGGMFSLDNGTGKRFLTRSRLFTDDEAKMMRA